MIAEHFIPGRVAPVGVVTDFDAVAGAWSARSPRTRGVPVEEMLPESPARSRRRARTDLGAGRRPTSRSTRSRDAATDAIPAMRAAARARRRGGAPVLVGGEVAEAYDTREALARDTRLIVPVTLVLILLILACCCAPS